MKHFRPVGSIAELGADPGQSIARHFSTTMHGLASGSPVERGDGFLRVRTKEPHPFANFTIVDRPNDVACVSAAIESLVGGDGDALPSAVVLPIAGAPAAPIHALLTEHGYALAQMPAMAVAIDDLASTTEPAGTRFVRVRDAKAGDAWGDCFERGYELPRNIARAFAPAGFGADLDADDAELRYYAIQENGETIATTFVHG